jgi:hypothetical protein
MVLFSRKEAKDEASVKIIKEQGNNLMILWLFLKFICNVFTNHSRIITLYEAFF